MHSQPSTGTLTVSAPATLPFEPFVIAWNDTGVNFPFTTLHTLIERQMDRTPDRCAVKFEQHTLSYAELDRRANQLAHFLLAHGVQPDTLVGICMERSLEMVIALVAVLKAGAAYLPIDPDYPLERLTFMLDDAQLPILLTQSHLVARLPLGDTPRLALDAEWETVAAYAETRPNLPLTPDHLAYTIYTSGSTGNPKGAMNTHRGIVNRLLWMQNQYGLTEDDTVLQKTPFSFDVSVWEFFWPLLTGARMVLAKPNGHRDSSYLVQLIENESITVIHFVPSMLQLFLTDREVSRCRSLRHVICSGEALSLTLQTRFFEQLSAELHNLYGPTEAAVDVSYWRCRPDQHQHTVPIGKPVANTQLYILDEAMNPVPLGAEGELYIGGVQVARGYWNRPKLSAERFLPDPFFHQVVPAAYHAQNPHPQLYKTGDLARYLSDGNIDFLGRIDHQVKLRGFRIELGEIEVTLEKHPSIHEACVMMREDKPGDQRLVAYLVQKPEAVATQQTLQTWLGRFLPDYMVPSAFVTLPHLPLSPNGKRDRKALPAPNQNRPALDTQYAPPRNPLESYLVELWQDILNLDQVGIDDRFFDLGGSSLQGAQFINRLKDALGEFIYIVTLFAAPTIAEYAQLLRRDYQEAIARRFGREAIPATTAPTPTQTKLTFASFAKMRRFIPTLGTNGKVTAKNPRAVFILAPPRSGTTLLRVMLAGHSGLFSTSELLLLNWHTLAERKEAYIGRYSLWQEGLIRTLMEINACTAETAIALIDEKIAQGMTTQQMYAELQAAIAPRLLVEKTPAYALDLTTLQHAEAIFDQPLYLHLVRHPYSMIHSFVKNHIAGALYLKKHDFSDRALGELIWTITHQNSLAFLREIPANRQQRIYYEQLVTAPAATMRALCEQFQLPFEEGMIQPYQNAERKMVDGIYAESTPMGDTHFQEHGRIKAERADSWQKVREDNFLSNVTWELAAELGYEKI